MKVPVPADWLGYCTSGFGAAPAAVPVPAALPLLLSGLVALGVAGRRRGLRRFEGFGSLAVGSERAPTTQFVTEPLG
jgi:hypothetical protein